MVQLGSSAEQIKNQIFGPDGPGSVEATQQEVASHQRSHLQTHERRAHGVAVFVHVTAWKVPFMQNWRRSNKFPRAGNSGGSEKSRLLKKPSDRFHRGGPCIFHNTSILLLPLDQNGPRGHCFESEVMGHFDPGAAGGFKSSSSTCRARKPPRPRFSTSGKSSDPQSLTPADRAQKEASGPESCAGRPGLTRPRASKPDPPEPPGGKTGGRTGATVEWEWF